MQEIYDLITRVSPTSSTVLLTGETGVGKDMVAQTIHRLSRRAEKPFVPVNCGAIQPTLIESELFGHEAGSFTGASRTRKGIFEQAQGGTLFLDEITEMQIDMQVKLLRVLETRQIKRVGGEKPIDVDVRLIAATNRSPESAVKDGKLREDLFYRLRVFPIRVPGLRERERDIELLATYFLTELNGDYEQPKRFLPAALDRMQSYDWPGNVRELRNVVERAAILAGERIGPEHVQIEGSADRRRSGSEIAVEVGSTIAEAEKQLILATLERLNENKKEAAATLGISLKTLYNRLNVYGIGRSDNS
jgi:DNA-binding NtrC family response regulator